MEIIVIMLIAWGATKYGISDAAAAVRGETPARWERADARRERRDTRRAERQPFFQRGAARRYTSLVTQDAIDDLAERHTRKRAERKARYEAAGEAFNEDTDAHRMTIPERVASAIGKGVQRVKNHRDAKNATTPGTDPVDEAFDNAPREAVATPDPSLSASSPVDSDNPTVNINEVKAPHLVPSTEAQLRQRLLDQCDPFDPDTTINAYERHLQWHLDQEPHTEAEAITAREEATKAMASFRREVHNKVQPELEDQEHADRLAESTDVPLVEQEAGYDRADDVASFHEDDKPMHKSQRYSLLPPSPDLLRRHPEMRSEAAPYNEEIARELMLRGDKHDHETSNANHTTKENNMGAEENSIEATSLVNSRTFAQGVETSANDAQVAVERNKAFMASRDVQGEPIELSGQLHEALGTVASLSKALDDALSKQTALREQYMANPDAGNKDFLSAG